MGGAGGWGRWMGPAIAQSLGAEDTSQAAGATFPEIQL